MMLHVVKTLYQTQNIEQMRDMNENQNFSYWERKEWKTLLRKVNLGERRN